MLRRMCRKYKEHPELALTNRRSREDHRNEAQDHCGSPLDVVAGKRLLAARCFAVSVTLPRSHLSCLIGLGDTIP